ncbi:aminotransferase class IV [Legionella worsleiensis]|uniref:Aminodeoxychorismate lyase n=1 Tax=Legionella worsleiensis TaxID=45076 RepID=A0A0W1AAC4_9GAMM|nr:aminotransferase class IV [Legionella worsleiensis]KTD78231.1 4-amino-4-deoxychorismate lyase [Legionella worsleiensis]STY32568.1 4-amino-4-deoxychorismate lyase [Legionella worsleiensis]
MHTRVLIDKGDVIPGFGIDDRIFLGEGLFETIKVDSSHPCFAALHWQRMADSAHQLGIAFDLSLDDWYDCLIQQIRRDNLYHGGVKAILSGGSAPRGLVERSQVSQLILQTFNYQKANHPVRLVASSWLRDAANPIYRMKTVNYLEAVLARRQAITMGADDALFFNLHHCATETTCANLFLIKNNQLITPPLDHGILPGITRSRIVSLCEDQGIPFREQGVTKAMINEADALFIANSLHGIRAVFSVDEVIFAVTHPLIEQLIALLSSDELDNAKKQNSYPSE